MTILESDYPDMSTVSTSAQRITIEGVWVHLIKLKTMANLSALLTGSTHE